ncbi:uncharacterized protein N7483_005884 [Penicillium malachiteum]|uniref:uncharacterized protein n=1 Tax=Penicillium malachiteum TaxID=1324776 RepID=UPI002548B9E1|nr:uncharacterized protein N7483_005884 [Penicillium malachiteum]KAJ5731376.1 hypothetical protein N7483_005884 [Penicillium malachiteum]
MKFLQSFFALSLLGAAVAIPTINSVAIPNDKEISIVNRDLACSHLEERSSCVDVVKAIYATVTMEAAIIFLDTSSLIIKKIYKKTEAEDCVYWAEEVKEIMDILQGLSATKKGYGAVAAYLATHSAIHWDRRSFSNESDSDAPEDLGDVLRSIGYEYDAIHNTTSPSGRDYVLLGFEDGTGQLHVSSTGFGNTTASYQKRTSAAGVKVAFKLGSARVTSSSARDASALAIATKFLSYAKEGYANMLGFVEKENVGALFFRTIFELDGFGLNYESLTICGSMASYIGTYLGSG